jgi:hypothetical protein
MLIDDRAPILNELPFSATQNLDGIRAVTSRLKLHVIVNVALSALQTDLKVML